MLVPEIVPPVLPVYVSVYILATKIPVAVLLDNIPVNTLGFVTRQSLHPLNVYPVSAIASYKDVVSEYATNRFATQLITDAQLNVHHADVVIARE
jgi:hypothetical protein